MAFNLKKLAEQTQEEMLQPQREDMTTNLPTGVTDKLLDGVRANKDIDKTTEGTLKSVRKHEKGDKITEGQIESHTVPADLPARNGKDQHSQLPINLLNEVADKEKVKAVNRFNSKDAKTELWDKLLGVEQPQSQLHNDTSRFRTLSDKDVLEDTSVRKMVMASLQDADAMVFYIHHQAASEKREINQKEQVILNGIADAKEKMLGKLLGNG